MTIIKSKFKKNRNQIDKNLLERAFRLMATAKTMTETYEANFKTVAKYVHATSRGMKRRKLRWGCTYCHKILSDLIIVTIAFCWQSVCVRMT